MALPTKIDPYLGLFFICAALKKQLMDIGINTLFIEPGNPWENGIESFNAHLKEELLDREIFLSIEELVLCQV